MNYLMGGNIMVRKKKVLKVAAPLLAMSMLFSSAGLATAEVSNGKSDYSQDQKVVSRVDAARAIEHVRYLSEEIGPRPGGLQAEKESAEYIGNVLKSYGYEVEFQYFPVADQYIADVAFADGTSWQMAAAPNGKVSKDAVTGEVIFRKRRNKSF
jgi:aminopeptidase YwaD